MINYNKLCVDYINKILTENRYRLFEPLNKNRCISDIPNAYLVNGTQIVVWCSNDYLGMSNNQKLIDTAKHSIEKYGIGSGGTRNISGTTESIVKLEQEIAALHTKESSLVFTSGYIANDSALVALSRILPDLVFFSDELNHASIISGIYNSRSQKYIYKHLNMDHLEELLQKIDINTPKIIIFESIYSMDGSVSPIQNICALAKKYNALTYIDEVHSVGLYGEQGAGLANMLGYEDKIDIIQATLAKAFGVIGGYIASNTVLIDAIRLNSKGFIFTTSLPPVITDTARESIKYLRHSNIERTQHKQVINSVKNYLNQAGIRYIKNDTHIIAIVIGDPNKAKQASEMLLRNHNIFIQHINFPTVPRGTERLRITPTQLHTESMIKDLIAGLLDVFYKLKIDLPLQEIA
ncbi:5-aminolevulinate synthase [Rickettsia endosymbiont of Cardiosporidium cionae]|uniref:5-aminolevulinate synthase n=1 Tax=Rickettsia endosymbiont of Cardiosporidium cionae TaxID=2777155 RepID=UPI0018944C47|nr:5-aminolevulinate synthase [Rickettsia endosymbiont of Cardiosporidium cionae]KAF8818636.1 5-aminolevulinate synthase [Rickettsia endosymbiont of Cardiosporidium cionae]